MRLQEDRQPNSSPQAPTSWMTTMSQKGSPSDLRLVS